MSDENTTQETGQSTNNEQISDFARKLITEANNEAAKYRNQKNTIEAETTQRLKTEFEEQFKSLSDEKSALAAERDTASSSYEKLIAALEAGVPGETAVEFAAILQGSNKDEYKAHADKLKSMFGAGGRVKPIDHSAGLSGETTSTPEEAFAALFQSNMRKR